MTNTFIPTLGGIPLYCVCTSHRWPFVELRQSLPSRVEAISPFVDQRIVFSNTFRNVDASEINIEIALREVLTNPVVHGNHEDPNRCVCVVSRRHADEESRSPFEIRERGLTASPYPTRRLRKGSVSTHGRGIYPMRALMDEIYFDEGGSVVHMRKTPNDSREANSEHGISK